MALARLLTGRMDARRAALAATAGATMAAAQNHVTFLLAVAVRFS